MSFDLQTEPVGRANSTGHNSTGQGQVDISRHEDVGLRCANQTCGIDWRDTIWGEIATLEYGKAIRDYQNASGTVPVYGTNGLIGWHHTPLCPFASVIIGRKGAYRGIHYSSKPFFVIDTAFYLKPKERLDTKWAYYCLLTYDINGMDSGSAIPSTSRDEFYKLPVRIPSFSEQQQIAKFLSMFDDRIALLRETNATLEAIAQALFKSWFVDFDPVHAKQQGRMPEGMDEATATFFPDSFEESELGLVPRGWRATKCQSIIDVRDGTHESPKPALSGYPLITSRHITSGKISFDDTYLISEQDFENISKRSKVDRFDVLITMIGTVGIPVIVLEEKTEFAIKNIGLFKTSAVPYLSHYVYLLLSSKNMQQYLESRLAGTTQKYLSLKSLREIVILVPSESVLAEFSNIISPIFEQIYQNIKQAQTLTRLRDTLLPRLISGQLRLPEAEELLKETAA
jgi:type I restriction enzyme S subunit